MTHLRLHYTDGSTLEHHSPAALARIEIDAHTLDLHDGLPQIPPPVMVDRRALLPQVVTALPFTRKTAERLTDGARWDARPPYPGRPEQPFTVRELVLLTVGDLNVVPRFGVQAIREIVRVLGNLGLRLGMGDAELVAIEEGG